MTIQEKRAEQLKEIGFVSEYAEQYGDILFSKVINEGQDNEEKLGLGVVNNDLTVVIYDKYDESGLLLQGYEMTEEETVISVLSHIVLARPFL